MDVDDRAHRVLVGKLDVVEEAAAQEGVRQFLFVIGRDDDDGALLGLDRLVRLVNVEFHPVEFLQQVVRELDIGLVDFVDEQDRPLLAFEGFPELALGNVVADVLHALVAELAVAQARNGVVFIEALMRLGRRFDVPGDEFGIERLGDLLGQNGLAGAGLTLHQKRTLERDRGIDRDAQIVGGDVIFRSLELHGFDFLYSVAARRRPAPAFINCRTAPKLGRRREWFKRKARAPPPTCEHLPERTLSAARPPGRLVQHIEI